jgi:hypothetical protein
VLRVLWIVDLSTDQTVCHLRDACLDALVKIERNSAIGNGFVPVRSGQFMELLRREVVSIGLHIIFRVDDIQPFGTEYLANLRD